MLIVLVLAALLAVLVYYGVTSGRRSVASPSKPDTSQVVRLEGDGDYKFEVVGESYHQDALAKICGGHCEDGHELETTALLVPESDNPHDANAVAVYIDGEKVAHLSRADALDYRRAMASQGFSGLIAHCDAMIVGGWDRVRRGKRDQGSFGVRLDVSEPLGGRVVQVSAT